MKNYTSLKKELLKDKKIRAEYDALSSEFSLIEQLIEKRLDKGFTQSQLAKKVGTKQSAISRLESGSYNPSISFLQKVAVALDAELTFSLS